MNPVKALTPELRDKRLLESFKKGDTIKPNRRHQGEWLVSSSQYPNVWYRVQYAPETGTYSCGCEWWKHKHAACRHLVRVSYHVHELRRKAKPMAASTQEGGTHASSLSPLPAAVEHTLAVA